MPPCFLLKNTTLHLFHFCICASRSLETHMVDLLQILGSELEVGPEEQPSIPHVLTHPFIYSSQQMTPQRHQQLPSSLSADDLPQQSASPCSSAWSHLPVSICSYRLSATEEMKMLHSRQTPQATPLSRIHLPGTSLY